MPRGPSIHCHVYVFARVWVCKRPCAPFLLVSPTLCAPIHDPSHYLTINLSACVRACVRARKALRLRLRVYVVPLPRYLLRVRGTRMHEQPSHTCTHTHSKNLRVSPFFSFSLASCNCFFFSREREGLGLGWFFLAGFCPPPPCCLFFVPDCFRRISRCGRGVKCACNVLGFVLGLY